MRIVAGKWRGKKLISPTTIATRPTADRAKETLFNILESNLKKNGKTWAEITFCDVFSGAGAVGIEAMSRGAKKVLFFENDTDALVVLNKNLSSIEAFSVSRQDALKPSEIKTPVNILFMDAPYGKGLWQLALTAFDRMGWIDKSTEIIIEIDRDFPELPPDGFTIIQKRNSGRNVFLFLKK